MPTCGQCEKRQQKCPGYRNMVDLMFRDESHHVIKRATTSRKRGKKMKHDTTAGILTDAITPPSPSRSSLSVSPSLALRQSRRFTADTSSSSEDDVNECATTEVSGGTPITSDLDDDQGRTYSNGIDSSTALATSDTSRISYGPADSVQERGIAFFFARYVATDHGCYQNYDFIYDVWKPPPSFDTDSTDCITASMTAVGLTSLSKLTRCPETFRRARQSYTIALGLANAALSNPAEAVKDSTMLAVLILGTYEFVSGRTPQTIRAWQDHVNGAATLASMRGATQFRTKAGARMFIMLCHTVLISCIRSGLPMPQSMVHLRSELWHLTDTSGPIWRVVDTLYNALQVRHDINSGKVVGVDAVVEKLCGVEHQFSTLISSLPPGWYYQQAKLTQPHPAVLGDSCHIYRGLTQATTWNGIRTMRMLVQESIVDVLCGCVDDPTMLPAHHQLELVKAMKLIEMLGQAFIASVPQHFGVVSGRDVVRDRSGRQKVSPIPTTELPHRILNGGAKQKALTQGGSGSGSSTPSALAASASRKPTLFDPTQSSGHERGAERFLTLATASHTIIWPLYTLGMSSSTTPETLAYVLDRLEAIYQETGFEQARVVSNIVKEQVHTIMWDQIPTANLPQIPESALPIMV